MPPTPTPFTVDVPEAVLEDLNARLRMTRWPADPRNEDWSYGANRAYLEELVEYWLEGYDWRATERAINAHPNYRVTIDDVPIHFIHERGRGPAPIPLILSHGWPWTFWDFRKVIGPLSDPAAYGGDPADAFDVVVPSLPGFGFSTPLEVGGVNFRRTAELWVSLMRDVLGYDRFAAQGGDWGALVTSHLGHAYADDLVGIHLSLALSMDFFTEPLPGPEEYAEDEAATVARNAEAAPHLAGHVNVQVNDPQTLSYGLHDSPVGLCAWLMDRRRTWGDTNGDVESRFSKDDLLDTAMIYWVSDSFVTSARYYAEAARTPWTPVHDRTPVVEAPTALAVFPQEVITMPRAWQERYHNLQRRTLMPAGGHFAPMEVPDLLVEDVRAFFRPLRD